MAPHSTLGEPGVGWGKNIRQRAEALTGIAHPDFRAGLLAAAGLGAGTALLHD
jgi:hypothetical protein